MFTLTNLTRTRRKRSSDVSCYRIAPTAEVVSDEVRVLSP